MGLPEASTSEKGRGRFGPGNEQRREPGADWHYSTKQYKFGCISKMAQVLLVVALVGLIAVSLAGGVFFVRVLKTNSVV